MAKRFTRVKFFPKWTPSELEVWRFLMFFLWPSNIFKSNSKPNKKPENLERDTYKGSELVITTLFCCFTAKKKKNLSKLSKKTA